MITVAGSVRARNAARILPCPSARDSSDGLAVP
jgi:hypothetical protein